MILNKQEFDLIILIIVVVFSAIAAIVSSRPPKEEKAFKRFRIIFVLAIIMWITIIVYTFVKLR